MYELPIAFAALGQYAQFINYIIEPDTKNAGKLIKKPVDYRTGRVANAHDPNIWADFSTASVTAKANNRGVGFVLTKVDPFFFIDIDACYDPTTQQWAETANRLVSLLNGAAIEVSSSQRGLHIIGTSNALAHRCKNEVGGIKIEMYTSDRFIALTGYHAHGNAGYDVSAILPSVVNEFFPPVVEVELATWTDVPRADWNGPSDDAELIARALKSRSARSVFDSSATFIDLWTANTDTLSKAFPPNNPSDPYDASSADAALAQHLSFWTGCNCERIYSLMKQSALARPKWEREGYITITIQKACGRQVDVLKDKPTEPVEQPLVTVNRVARGAIIEGNTHLYPAHQIELFAGCTYVRDAHAVLIPGGELIKPDVFKVVFGGYTFVLDHVNEKTSRDPWKVFTESLAIKLPRVQTVCFRPDLEPGTIINRDGNLMVNIWWPVQVARKTGDISPFINHLRTLLPDEQDRLKLLCFMAACVQYPGVKFQWCPLIQGTEGNGKTLFTRCVAAAIGLKYSHFPKAAEIAAKFNDWMYQKLFIGVEDIYVTDSRIEVLEALKPMITSEYQEIEPKGGKKVTREVCCNFILNSNHKDAIRKTKNDRRFAPFYTAQQEKEDLARDGLDGEYFPQLYSWLRNGGYAIVAEFLHTFPILDEYNPATKCQRAPDTTSTQAAIRESQGSIEQEIIEAIDGGQVGFRGGWVSSFALNTLLDKIRAGRRIPHNRRRELMRSIGYDYHPALKDGRVNTMVLPDGGKPRLYIANEHRDLTLTNTIEVGRAYSAAQNVLAE